MEESIQQEIKCTIFLETDKVIQNIIAKYWKVNSKEKQYYLQDISLEIKALLMCSKYNSSNSDCLNCHYILRKYLQEYKPHSSLLQSPTLTSWEE
jgi:hypothetical protein